MSTKNNAAVAKDGNNTQAGERAVQESRAVSIAVEGGTISGVFVKFSTRTSKDGKEYSGWIVEGTGVIEDRKTGKPAAALAGRYFIFGANRLDRQMREVERGEKIKISYLGMEKNEVAGPDGNYGKHHNYKVVYID
jgi:hypothetical protein